MLIHEIAHVGERAPNTGRWIAAARASRRQANVTPSDPIVSIEANADDGNGDEISDWASGQGMTLAAVQAAYELI